jgi:predicted nicotinamide N-methyase
MAHISRSDVLARIHNRVGRGEPVILAGTGVGLVAPAAAAAGTTCSFPARRSQDTYAGPLEADHGRRD